jgi:predicted alpha/beta-hydrolase family hydrolase
MDGNLAEERFRSWNIEYLLKNIKSPLLFIQGEADEYGTLNQVEKPFRR